MGNRPHTISPYSSPVVVVNRPHTISATELRMAKEKRRALTKKFLAQRAFWKKTKKYEHAMKKSAMLETDKVKKHHLAPSKDKALRKENDKVALNLPGHSASKNKEEKKRGMKDYARRCQI